MKILVVGGAGYIGSHMVKGFKKLNIKLKYLIIYRQGMSLTLKITSYINMIYAIKRGLPNIKRKSV